MTSSNQEDDREGEWVVEASLAMTELIEEEDKLAASIVEEDEGMALVVVNHNQASYKKYWVVDSGCANHMIGDNEKLQTMSQV